MCVCLVSESLTLKKFRIDDLGFVCFIAYGLADCGEPYQDGRFGCACVFLCECECVLVCLVVFCVCVCVGVCVSLASDSSEAIKVVIIKLGCLRHENASRVNYSDLDLH